MTHLFISDLHLSPDHPRLVRGFLDLLKQYSSQHTQLYILGDWFNAWIGDDYSAPWLDDIIQALHQFSAGGNQVYFCVGNRDFALHHTFLDKFNGVLLPEVSYISIGNTRIRLEHGDGLCTDDVSYQRFKKVIRNPFLIWLLRKTPLSFRTKLAEGFRAKSHESKELKSYDIMDVNENAVQAALSNVDLLIHGHTHRPEIHAYDQENGHPKFRIVLGDWRQDQAKILQLEDASPDELKLIDWNY